MLSFLPKNNKNNVIKEYLSRLLAVFLTFLSLSILILIFLFVPSAIFSKYKYQTVKNQLESMKISDMNSAENPVELVKKINAMVRILSDQKSESILMSEMIQKIVTIKNKDIKITSISILKDVKGSEKISISGVAKTRDALTLFDRDLKNDGLFASVDLPVSNLIKNTDAPFTIMLTYNKK